MSQDLLLPSDVNPDPETGTESVAFDFQATRRQFVQFLGAGLLISVRVESVLGQRGQKPRGGEASIAARLHLGKDGTVTLLTGKVEMGQGARMELTQAAAEELRLDVDKIQVIMGDTSLVPDDGITAGSRTTPGTVPPVRRAAAAARQLLLQLACKRWNVPSGEVLFDNRTLQHKPSGRAFAYGELAQGDDFSRAAARVSLAGVEVTPVADWKILGHSHPRPNGRDLVLGRHKFPSDLVRPGTLHGKILRPPRYGQELISVDVSRAQALKDVVVVQDGSFVGVAAPTTFQARQALEALAATARWTEPAAFSSKEIFDNLVKHLADGLPPNPFAEKLVSSHKTLRGRFNIPFVQHAPMEPRAALAEWHDGGLSVWTGTQNPFGYHAELCRVFRLPRDKVRVIVPDFGGGFGGKHTGEVAIEAARLARQAGRPVSLVWTREEEFTWAYFRPAGVIDIEATLDRQGTLTSWYFLNVNSGPAALETPYRTGQSRCRFLPSRSPVRQGSYRALAAPANTFARECFMDELAAAAGMDPLAFRLKHLEHPRLRAVLEEAAKRFPWPGTKVQDNVGFGLACGTEKGSYVAACVEIALDRSENRIEVRRVCEVFECGGVLNPDNLRAQVQGCILMGLGPILREEMRFEGGKVLNASFGKYRVPRLSDLPVLELHQLNRPDLPSAGGGETPIIAVAPAVANALFQITGKRVRALPVSA